jgi:hypothetical protein
MRALRDLPFARALLALLALLLAPADAVVTWQQIGCGGIAVAGATLDQMWDNAKLMASNANTVIDTAVNAKIIVPLTKTSAAADNAKWMFGIDVTLGAVLPSSSKNYLTNTIKPIYNGIQTQMAGNNGFLVCNDAAAVYGPIGGCEFWHNPFPIHDGICRVAMRCSAVWHVQS